MLTIFTSSMVYVGADAVDISRGAAKAKFLHLAPSQEILSPVLEARRAAERLTDVVAAQAMESAAWSVYSPKYVAEQRALFAADRVAYDELLEMECVTLRCFCNLKRWPGHCHRIVLASILVVGFGATYAGERRT